MIPDEMLQQIAPALISAQSSSALSSLRQSATARFHNGSVSGSDDEKPEPLTLTPRTDSPRSPPAVQLQLHDRRGSMWAGEAPRSNGLSVSDASASKRHSMWAGASAAPSPSSSKRLSLSQTAQADRVQSNLPESGPANSPQMPSPPPAVTSSASAQAFTTKRPPSRSSLSIVTQQPSPQQSSPQVQHHLPRFHAAHHLPRFHAAHFAHCRAGAVSFAVGRQAGLFR